MTDRPPPEQLMTMGLFIHEFGQLERTIDVALTEAVVIVQAINPSECVPHELKKRVQKLLTFHRTKSPMKACRSKAEPLLQELKKLLLMRNDIAHGRQDEYQHDIASGAERVAALRRELIAAMTWRS
jgi:cell division protein ZapA (FtsZ GTPase activity inhibitor)